MGPRQDTRASSVVSSKPFALVGPLPGDSAALGLGSSCGCHGGGLRGGGGRLPPRHLSRLLGLFQCHLLQEPSLVKAHGTHGPWTLCCRFC